VKVKLTTKTVCPSCTKYFTNLNLHMTKTHKHSWCIGCNKYRPTQFCVMNVGDQNTVMCDTCFMGNSNYCRGCKRSDLTGTDSCRQYCPSCFEKVKELIPENMRWYYEEEEV